MGGHGTQIVLNGFRRIFKRMSMCGDCLQNLFAVETEQADNEIVRMLCGKVVDLKIFGRKVGEIKGHDQICTAMESSSDNVTIVGVRKLDRRDQVFEAFRQTVSYVAVHQHARALKLLAGQIRTVCQDISDPLVVNHIAPAGPKQVGQCQIHQQIA